MGRDYIILKKNNIFQESIFFRVCSFRCRRAWCLEEQHVNGLSNLFFSIRFQESNTCLKPNKGVDRQDL
jgi:hypothetical protein